MLPVYKKFTQTYLNIISIKLHFVKLYAMLYSTKDIILNNKTEDLKYEKN